MSLTDSNMLELGTEAPKFELEDIITLKPIHLEDASNYIGTVIIFICNHCPYVIHLIAHLSSFAKKYQNKGFQFIAINSNDVTKYIEDSPEKMIDFAKKYDLSFPYCFDETQEIAKAYHAACTPDFYLFDTNLKLVYRGRYDSSRPQSTIPITGSDLSHALESILHNESISELQYPSAGCNIKWK
ncbi:MAG: thioredoxin family protein [Saprospiraceae bacterium]